MIRLRLLGPVELTRDDGSAVQSVLAQPKRVAILAYLALANPGGFVRRDTLLALFWPDSDDAHARRSLNQAIYFLRRSLGDEVIVSRGDEELAVDPARLSLDVLALRAAAERGDAELEPGLVKGELMEGFHAEASVEFEHWLDARRSEARAWADILQRAGTPRTAAVIPPGSLTGGGLRRSRRYAATAVAMAVATVLMSAASIALVKRNVPAAEADQPRALASPARETDGRLRIAVLPCIEIPETAENEVLILGIADQVITELSRSTTLRPTALTSVMRYRGAQRDLRRIADDLQVRSILQCTIFRDRSRLRINFQLVDAETETQLWSEPHTADLADLMSPGSTIGLRVARSLAAELGRQRPRDSLPYSSRNEEAWFDYLRGRQLTSASERDLEAAITYFEKAIAADPSFAAAHAGLGAAVAQLGIMGLRHPREARDSARAAAERALSLDPDLAEAHGVLATIRFRFDWDWAAAEEGFRLAHALQPTSVTVLEHYAVFLLAMRRFPEGIGLLIEGVSLDPVNPYRHAMLGFGHYLSGDYGAAVAQLRRAQVRFPDADGPTLILAWSYTAMENHRDALAAVREVEPLLQDDPWLRTSLAVVAAAAGDRTSAEEILADLEAMQERRYVDPANFAKLFAALGDTTRALDMLEAAYRAGSSEMVFLGLDDPFDRAMLATRRGAELRRSLRFPGD